MSVSYRTCSTEETRGIAEPTAPMITPSMMNGALTNTFVAPISFMIPISSFRTVIPMVIVLLIRNIDTSISITTIPMDAYPTRDDSVVMLMLVSIFLISNTITIGITVRKEEIGIMKLIGATNVFVRAPFIIEGVIIGAVGSAIPLVLLYYMYDKILTYVAGRFKVVTTLFAFVSQQDTVQDYGTGRTCARYRCWSGRKYSYHKKALESVVLNAVRAMHKKFTNCYYFFRDNMCYNADK